MPDRVGNRLLCDPDDLALDTIAEARQLVEMDVDRNAARLLSEVCKTLDRLAQVLSLADIRTKGADRAPRFHHMRAGEIDRDVDVARRLRRSRAFALRGLELHEDGAESLREVVVNIARQAIALLEDRLAAFFQALLLVDAA